MGADFRDALHMRSSASSSHFFVRPEVLSVRFSLRRCLRRRVFFFFFFCLFNICKAVR
jgi:hypothetical protein